MHADKRESLNPFYLCESVSICGSFSSPRLGIETKSLSGCERLAVTVEKWRLRSRFASSRAAGSPRGHQPSSPGYITPCSRRACLPSSLPRPRERQTASKLSGYTRLWLNPHSPPDPSTARSTASRRTHANPDTACGTYGSSSFATSSAVSVTSSALTASLR